MKKILLTKGKYAIVDDEDYELISQYRWHVTTSGYAKRYSQNKTIYMHRQIYGDCLIDHINQDKLDNRKKNLRPCTRSQNQANRKIPSSNTSGHKGVAYDNQRKKWRSYIRVNGKQKFLGYFDEFHKAVSAYRTAAKQHFGEFASY